jgi:hypothetical protein
MKGYQMRYISVVAQFVDARFHSEDIRSGAARYWAVAIEIGSAVSEGLASAQRYDRLARMISVERAELSDVARIAILGRAA